MPEPLQALVTGSNGGIGRAIVDRLRADGFSVLTLDLEPPAELIVDLGCEPVPEQALSALDVCVSNAGIVDVLSPGTSPGRR